MLEGPLADGGDAVGHCDVAVRVGRVQAARRSAAECEQDQDRREHLLSGVVVGKRDKDDGGIDR